MMTRHQLAGALLVALGGTGGFILADRALDRETAVTLTRTAPAADVGIPAAVARKRDSIRRAAEAKDYEELARLADRKFTYTLGGSVAGGAAAYWREAERQGQRPLEALAAILTLPYTLSRGVFVWPFAYDRTPGEITEFEATLLKRIPGGATVGPSGYLGWRAGIGPDGRWLYFVAGD